MGRPKRFWSHQNVASYHLLSRTTGADFLLNRTEKEFFVKLLFRLSKGFFVSLHSYTVMSNHFHILATGLDEEAKAADTQELISRYRLIFGKNADYPRGKRLDNGDILEDEDGGIQRLRERLGSISRFMQELKQQFSCWFNKRHNRKGYLWDNRYTAIHIEKGVTELICSSYIDLNPVRAGIVKKPEAYRWSSIGLRVRNPRKANQILTTIPVSYSDSSFSAPKFKADTESTVSTKSEVNRKFEQHAFETRNYIHLLHQQIGLFESKGDGPQKGKHIHQLLQYRFKNLSDGIAIGSASFIMNIQRRLNRKVIRPRQIIQESERLWTTRVYSEPNPNNST